MPATLTEDFINVVGLEDIEGGGRGGVSVQRKRPVEVESLKTVFQPGDILYGKLRPYLNKVALAPTDGICSTEIWAFTVLPFVDAYYAQAFIASPFFVERVASLMKGANLPRLDAGAFDSIEIPIPPVSEQRRIAEILREAEQINRLRVVAEERTTKLLPRLFQFTFSSSLKKGTNLERRYLGDISDVQGGVQVSRRRENLPNRVPYLRVANVQRGALVLDEVKEIGVTQEELERTLLKRGDILVVEGHGNITELGRAAVWTGEIERCTHQNHLIRIRCTEGIDPYYVAEVLNAPLGRRYFQRTGNTTSGLNTISTGVVRKFQIHLPDEDTLSRFQSVRESIAFLQEPKLKSSILTQQLVASLISEASTGRLTAKWREQNRTLLEREAAARDEDLKTKGAAFSRTAMIQEIDELFSRRTDGAFAELTREQYTVLEAVQRQYGGVHYPRWFSAEDVAKNPFVGSLRGNRQAVENHLSLLAARGLLIAVSREEPSPLTGELVFGNAYRLRLRDFEPEEGDEQEPVAGDDAHLREMERLVGLLHQERRQ